MGVSWTKEQQQVIELRNRDILVSAAAGSGKTAVLVERIISKITNKEHPVDIDRILVVTFTKAAAAEMRERVSQALETKLADCPDDDNLIRQSALIHNAMITTIDSFCLFVVRNHFNDIGIEPNFRIADEGERKLLEQDVLEQVFEQFYEKKDEKFLQLIDAYSGKRNDAAVKEMVMQIYRMSLSSPWPAEWIEQLLHMYKGKNEEELENTALFKELICTTRSMVDDIYRQVDFAKSLCCDPNGPQKYQETILDDLEKLEKACKLQTYQEFCDFFRTLQYKNFASIRNYTGDVQKKDAVKSIRDNMKKQMDGLKSKFSMNLTQLSEQIERVRPYAESLIELSTYYLKQMELAKRKKRIVDFSDMEHFALNILVDEKTKQPTFAAKEFQEHFDEIMIDEYQDSNLVQEIIMRTISGESQGKNNLFMVGDVKQSIYRFRLARPQLFMEKYKSYSKEESVQQKIDLHMNFRSRAEVLDFSNDIFYKLMNHDLGEVDYDDEAALYVGANYPKAEGMQTEFLLFDDKDFEGTDAEYFLSDEDKRRLEARMVASKIDRLLQTQQVTDKKTGELRQAQYSDIVILFRSMKGWGDEFADVLQAHGIPVHVESQTGYFSAIEVQTVLNMLRILDNPYQDIPMAAVLRSPIVGLDNEELAQIRSQNQDMPFAMAAFEAMKEAKEGPLASFFILYERLRSQRDLMIHELIVLLLQETGYARYVAAMPAGERREENLHMLIEKAIAFEKTSYKGLFHFMRYIESLQKYEVDFGEADVSGENANVVHIMTIHKSKGLEFPIVFVCGTGKQFNQSDTKSKIVLHPDLGMGLCEMSAQPRIKRKTILQEQIAEHIRQENLGEELRILYVALTRAKEKLILTGIIRDREKVLAKYVSNTTPKQPLMYSTRAAAGSYLDWLIPAVGSYPDKYAFTFVRPEELFLEEVEELCERKLTQEALSKEIIQADSQLVEQIRNEFSYEYPYHQDAAKKVKYSVSELKHASMEARFADEHDAQLPDFLKQEHDSYIPDFAKAAYREQKACMEETVCMEQKEQSGTINEQMDKETTGSMVHGVSRGALRGTAVHRVMECLDFEKLALIDSTNEKQIRQFVREELSRMCQSKELTVEMEALIYPAMIERFVSSEVAGRMAQAAVRGELFKEKPFVMEYEGVLVQGIIDVFWFEGDELVVLDYKTDAVSQAQELVMRYQTQLELYADALARIFSDEEKTRQVKERLLYSFRLQEEIRL